jgi:hypothetical protein
VPGPPASVCQGSPIQARLAVDAEGVTGVDRSREPTGWVDGVFHVAYESEYLTADGRII